LEFILDHKDPTRAPRMSEVKIGALPRMESITSKFPQPGSDANPYLAHAAALASGLYGIKT